MFWTDSLNQGPRKIELDGCTIEVLHWAYSASLPDNVLHRHTFYEVCLVGDYGAGIFTVKHETLNLKSGDLFIARPGILHRIQNTSKQKMELYWVSFIVLPEVGSAPKQKAGEHGNLLSAFADSPSLVIPTDGCIQPLWQALRSLGSMPARAGYRTQVHNTMASLLLAIAQAGAGDNVPVGEGFDGSNENVIARQAVRYIHDNLEKKLPVQEIAAHIHVSPRHLSRLFASHTGKSPATYIELARMSRARVLLQDNSIPIKTVALQIGYADVQHFTRAFRRHHSVAPAAFRRGEGPPPARKFDDDKFAGEYM